MLGQILFVTPLFYQSIKGRDSSFRYIIPAGGVCVLSAWPALMFAWFINLFYPKDIFLLSLSYSLDKKRIILFTRQNHAKPKDVSNNPLQVTNQRTNRLHARCRLLAAEAEQIAAGVNHEMLHCSENTSHQAIYLGDWSPVQYSKSSQKKSWLRAIKKIRQEDRCQLDKCTCQD